MVPVPYEGMAAHWPDASDAIASMMNAADKVVFSTTLKHADWRKSRVVTGNPAEEISRLKQQPGRVIGVAGGAVFTQSLAALSLIDEYRLTVHPVALGPGISLFNNAINLTLLD